MEEMYLPENKEIRAKYEEALDAFIEEATILTWMNPGQTNTLFCGRKTESRKYRWIRLYRRLIRYAALNRS